MGGPEPGSVASLNKPVFGDLQARVEQMVKEKEARDKRLHLGIPLGTWDALAHQAQINQLMDRITSGKSSIAFSADATQAFKDTQIAFLKELAQTPAGFQMMSDLDASKFKTTIGPGTAGSNQTITTTNGDLKADGTTGPGSNAQIKMNPTLTSFVKPGETEKPWMTERPKYGLYHEMVHAWTAVQGKMATGTHQGIDNSEWQATGFGPHTSASVSDNIIRQQMGKDPRPGYGGKVFDATAH